MFFFNITPFYKRKQGRLPLLEAELETQSQTELNE